MVLPALLLAGCAAKEAEPAAAGLTVTGHYPLEYAEQFTIDECAGGYSLVTIGEERYLVVPEDAPLPTGLEPDLTIFLNITPAAGMARKNRQDGHVLDRLEQEKAAFHEAVYAGYLQLAKENSTRIADIDADRPVEAVFADIRKALDRVFGFAPQK